VSENPQLLITELPGFTPEIGRLVSMLNYVRSTTLTAVAGLNNYFKWFHVFGHEINHRGQIRWLRARATRQAQ
jgi:hypothetical protein